jgi:NADPH-dependent glutamate synthase beta subunit-like oxidoreductase
MTSLSYASHHPDSSIVSSDTDVWCCPASNNYNEMAVVKRVAVIGAGPAGAITIDALAKEKAFDLIRVFERREAPGGCW